MTHGAEGYDYSAMNAGTDECRTAESLFFLS
jgi:hypothetical protein